MAAVGVPSWPHRARIRWRARAGAEWHRGPPLHKALERMPSQRAIAIHVGLVTSALVFFLYLWVPPMLSTYAQAGADMSLPLILLVAAYRWFVLLPVIAIATVQLVPASPRRLWFAVPVSYIIVAVVVAFALWAAYIPTSLLDTSQHAL